MSDDIDATDRGILYLLQQNARDATTTDIASEVDVAPSTVRNRIDRLEDRGVIRGYVPVVDYERAGYELRILFTCTASKQPTDAFVEEILAQYGVVSVRKLLAGDQNLHVEAVGTGTDDLSRIAAKLQEAGLDVVRSEVLEEERLQPFDHFGEDVAEDED